jgi:hypothetical protein
VNIMDNYQPEMHVALEQMPYILVGRTLIDMRHVIAVSVAMEVPLAFYTEGPGRFFIGRDYERMDPCGRLDFRVELLERLMGDADTWESLGGRTWESRRVQTAPLLRLWEVSLAPPLRESHVCDCTSPQYGLQHLVEAYVLRQNRDVPTHVRIELERMMGVR